MNAKFVLVENKCLELTREYAQQGVRLSIGDSLLLYSLDLFFALTGDAAIDCITDQNCSIAFGRGKGHDRGIDAIFIDEFEDHFVVSLCNSKHLEHKGAVNNHFPTNEFDKIRTAIHDILNGNKSLLKNANIGFTSKIQEIWKLCKSKSIIIKIHIFSNCLLGVEAGERVRIDTSMKELYGAECVYHFLNDYDDAIRTHIERPISCKLRINRESKFDFIADSKRGLVFITNALELLRIASESELLRNNLDATSDEIIGDRITPYAFSDNVRTYIDTKSSINADIVSTAISDTSCRIVFFNNGITITCNKFSVSNGPFSIITIENLQIVNGCQTIHALGHAARINIEKVNEASLLCRLYQIEDTETRLDIARYTNSQNPVVSRDIRSISDIQIRLEQSLLSGYGLFYERKARQHRDKDQNMVIDMQRAAQAMAAFYNSMPLEAKNRRDQLFGQYYDKIFDESTTPDKLLLAYRLLDYIEMRKNTHIHKPDISTDESSFVMAATYHLLMMLNEYAIHENVELKLENIGNLKDKYDDAYTQLKVIADAAQQTTHGYTHPGYFKTKRVESKIAEYFDSL
jgi:hypothetical protein